jgi:hypothetical protein
VHPELLNKDGTLDAEVARNHPELAQAVQKQRDKEQGQGKK